MYQTHRFSWLRSNRDWPGLIIFVFLTSCIFFQLYPTFDSYFMSDDFGWLRFAKSNDSVLNAALEPSLGDWTTPVPNIIFWALYRAFGFDPRGYYVVIALIQLFNSLLVYNLVYFTIHRVEVALGSAFIFALCFIHYSDWGPLVWISVFVQVVVASFYLASLVLFCRYLYLKKSRYYLGALVCFGLALASKETAVTLPILLLAWYIIGLPQVEQRIAKAVFLIGPFFAMLVVYLLYKLLLHQTSDRYLQVGLYGIGIHIISNWKYFSNLVIPNPQSPPVHTFLINAFPSWTLSLVYLATGLTRVGLAVVGIVLWWRGPKHLRLWIALSLIAYLPFIGFVGGHAGGAHRYFYLPLVGFSALLAEGLWWMFNHLSRQKGVAISTSLLAIVVLGLYGYNLLPIRTWQKQMRRNSQLTQQALNVTDEYISEREVQITKVYLEGFPTDEIRELRTVFDLVYSMDTKSVAPEKNDKIGPPADALILTYNRNRVAVHQP